MTPPRPRFTAGFRTEALPIALVAALGLDGRALDARAARDYREVRLPASWLEQPLGDDWRLALRLAVQAGAVVVAELRIIPREEWKGRPTGTWAGAWVGLKAPVPVGGVTTRLLRDVRLGHVAHETGDFLVWVRRTYGASTPFEPDHWLGGMVRSSRPGRQARRASPSDDAVVLVAAQYVAALLTQHRAPIKAVAQQLQMPPRDVSRFVLLARRRKFLTDTTQGKRGGTLTARALRLRRSPPPPPTRRRR